MNTDETPKDTEQPEPKKAGRPSKISKFVEATVKIFKEKAGRVFIFTDDELLFLVNEELEEQDQITSRTFERWKALLKEDKLDDLPTDFFIFCRLMKKALIAEKEGLMAAFVEEKQQWTKYAWIFERKFKDWNLNAINDFSDKLTDNKVEFILSEFNPENTDEDQLADVTEATPSLQSPQ